MRIPFPRPVLLLAPVILLLVFAPFASADVSGPPNHLVLPTDQIWAFIAGNLSPIVAYWLNYRAPWIKESIKGVVQLIASAIAAGLVQAITAGGVGFNSITLQFVVTGVLGALLAHKWFWQPSTISQRLGGGRNRQDYASRPGVA